MNKIGVAVALALAMLFATSGISLASDRDVAGKVMIGIGHQRQEYCHDAGRRHQQRIRVANYAWQRKWIPEHAEYDPNYGKILVKGHYIQYKVSNGGHWGYK